jgi:hypothetical protein
VWCSNWGDCHDTAIIGLADCSSYTVIETAYSGF